jgi:aspartate kinase
MLLIQKFGGTSVASVEHILRVATIIKESIDRGDQIIAVISAMNDETDRLITLMEQITDVPADREYSALLASGEQVSSALLALALHKLGVASVSYNAYQIELKTQSQHRKSHVSSVNARKLLDDTKQRIVPVVAGFQGINDQLEVTTLGRGGSDITAVALAAFLDADECQIYTDVNGVYSADPRVVPSAQLINVMNFDEMLAFAELGAKVLQQNSVEMARKYNVPLRVLSSFNALSKGTLIKSNGSSNAIVSGIASVDGQVKVTVCDIEVNDLAEILQHMKDELIDYDMLTQNQNQNTNTTDTHDMSFAISESELPRLCKLTHDFHIQTGIAKISLVGQGMQMHAGFAATILQLLAQKDIPVHSIFSTEIKVSILINADLLVQAVQILHNEFRSQSQKV